MRTRNAVVRAPVAAPEVPKNAPVSVAPAATELTPRSHVSATHTSPPRKPAADDMLASDLFPKPVDVAGPNVFPTPDMGEEVSVTWGEAVISPVQYNSFRVGPFSSTTRIRAGETRGDAMQRVLAELATVAEAELEAKRSFFTRALRAAKAS